MNKYHYVVNGFAGQILVGCYSSYNLALMSFDSFKNHVKHDKNCPNTFVEGAIFNDDTPHHTVYQCTCGIVENGEIWQVEIDQPLL